MLALVFPDVFEDIDWTHEVEILDGELQKLWPEGRAGRKLADRLIKVRLKSGDERYLHFDVQGDPDEHFSRRMFVYQYRGDDRFGLPLEALVILADESPDWRPTRYEVGLTRTRLVFEFEPVKLLNWADRTDELLAHENPVGLFLVAHLKSKATRGDMAERAAVKLSLIGNLLARKLDAEDRRQWYRMFDLLLELPPALDKQLWLEVGQLQKEGAMPFVTYAERYGMEKAYLAALESVLLGKFGQDGTALLPELSRIEEPARLKAILDAVVLQNASLDDVRQMLPPPTNGHPQP